MCSYIAVMFSRLLCKCFCDEEPDKCPWKEYAVICNLPQEVWHICSLLLKRGGLCVDLWVHDVESTSLQSLVLKATFSLDMCHESHRT